MQEQLQSLYNKIQVVEQLHRRCAHLQQLNRIQQTQIQQLQAAQTEIQMERQKTVFLQQLISEARIKYQHYASKQLQLEQAINKEHKYIDKLSQSMKEVASSIAQLKKLDFGISGKENNKMLINSMLPQPDSAHTKNQAKESALNVQYLKKSVMKAKKQLQQLANIQVKLKTQSKIKSNASSAMQSIFQKSNSSTSSRQTSVSRGLRSLDIHIL